MVQQQQLQQYNSGSQQQQQGQSSGQQQGQQGQQDGGESSKNTQDPHFTRLASAASILNSRISQDGRIEQATKLSEVLNSSASGDYVLPHNSAWQPFTKSRTVNLPDALFEEYNLLECRCYMGLFPEIERAWITVDHRLFLWDYQDGSGFTSFEEIQDIIVAVALVRPRPGVFIDSITHLLVLSTPLAVHLIGLSFIPAAQSQTGKASFELYILDLTIPTGDGKSITNIVGMTSGRIFGCSTAAAPGSASTGGAGELYEIIYNAKEGLFSKKCYLVNLSTGGSITGASWILPSFLRSGDTNNANHIVQVCLDKERDLLYTRTRNNTIELWNMQKGKSERVGSVRDVKRQAGMLCPGTPLLNGSQGSFEIVGMEVINQKEGKGVGLVCVTSSGVRMYFTHLRGGLRGYSYGSQSGQPQSPACLELVHVRLPPSLNQQQAGPYGQLSSNPSSPANNISITCLPNTGGSFYLFANTINDDTDVLLLFAPDIGRIGTTATSGGGSRSLVEVAGQVPIEGRTWAIAEARPDSGFPSVGQQYPSNELKAELSPLGQHAKREFLFLTNMGMHVVTRQRPVDTLLQLLSTAPGSGKDSELVAFAEAYGRDQTCAMLMSIMAGSSAVFGDRSSGNVSADLANAARRAYFDIGGRAMGVQRGLQVPNGAATTNEGKVLLSGRHEGLAIYFGRLLSALLSSKIVRPATDPQNPFRVDTNLPDGTLMKIQRDLGNLRTFLDSDTHLFGLIGDQWSGRSEAEANQAEQESAACLKSLLTQTIEAISFILLLIDYKLPDVVASCGNELAKTLVDMTYADLLTTAKGRDLARTLVSAIINMQIGQNLSVDAISDILQQRCGSFCSADDVLLYKAIENIRKAKSGPPSERTSNLRESLRLFQKAAAQLSSSKLSEVVQEYDSLRFQSGSIDLAMTCAETWDPEERGLSWWRDGSPKNDSRAPSWEPRNFCYERVLEALSSTDDLLNKAIEAGGRQGVTVEEADGVRSNAYARALSAQDEALHYKLYDWHLERGLTDQLLEIRSDYLEQYLLREPASLERYDLLWQYYARHFAHSKAASVLATLAESTEFPLTLNKRLEYLSLAASNAKSQYPNPSMRQDIISFLTEIDEKLEVGTVQVEVFRQVEDLQDLTDQQKDNMLKRLDERLFSISELYSEFAEPLELYEIMLLIFHVSDHRDETHVAHTWEAMLDKVIGDAPSDAEAVQALASKLVSFVKRFYPSEVALPLGHIVAFLEKYNMDRQGSRQPASPSGTDAWVPISLRDGGVPYDVLFAVYDDLFHSRIPPFDSQASAAQLLPAIISILSSWMKEVTVQGYSAGNSYEVFPANEVEAAVGRYLADVPSSERYKDIRDRLQDINRDIRKRF